LFNLKRIPIFEIEETDEIIDTNGGIALIGALFNKTNLGELLDQLHLKNIILFPISVTMMWSAHT